MAPPLLPHDIKYLNPHTLMPELGNSMPAAGLVPA
jgi:hypothetical protein